MSDAFDPRPRHARPADPTGRVPPGQRVTEKFPVLTAGTPRVTPQADWTLTVDGLVDEPYTLDWAGFHALPQREFTVDIHCVTRWSKLDTVWHGVALDMLFERAGVRDGADYMQAHADGDYASNLTLRDVTGGQAFVPPVSAASPSPKSMAAPRGWWCRVSISGRAPSGCAA